MHLTITQFAGLCAAPLFVVAALILRSSLDRRGYRGPTRRARYRHAQEVLDDALRQPTQDAGELLRHPDRLRRARQFTNPRRR
jgi:hypothetical protein